MNTENPTSSKKETQRLIDIESTDRLTSDSIDTLSNKPTLLKSYLDASIGNTFSELMFRLTHEIYSEKKASNLWNQIVKHRESLKKRLNRDLGLLVAALDYLSNISGDISNYDPGITVSIGVSCLSKPDVTTASELVRQADKAMYKVKRSGKNRVEKST